MDWPPSTMLVSGMPSALYRLQKVALSLSGCMDTPSVSVCTLRSMKQTFMVWPSTSKGSVMGTAMMTRF